LRRARGSSKIDDHRPDAAQGEQGFVPAQMPDAWAEPNPNKKSCMMSDTVWISLAPGSSTNLRPLTHSFSVSEEWLKHASACRQRNEAGESLDQSCFPEQIFGAPDAEEKDYRLPDIFFAGTFWAVSKPAADVLRQSPGRIPKRRKIELSSVAAHWVGAITQSTPSLTIIGRLFPPRWPNGCAPSRGRTNTLFL